MSDTVVEARVRVSRMELNYSINREVLKKYIENNLSHQISNYIIKKSGCWSAMLVPGFDGIEYAMKVNIFSDKELKELLAKARRGDV
jgi:hypothetical protein